MIAYPYYNPLKIIQTNPQTIQKNQLSQSSQSPNKLPSYTQIIITSPLFIQPSLPPNLPLNLSPTPLPNPSLQPLHLPPSMQAPSTSPSLLHSLFTLQNPLSLHNKSIYLQDYESLLSQNWLRTQAIDSLCSILQSHFHSRINHLLDQTLKSPKSQELKQCLKQRLMKYVKIIDPFVVTMIMETKEEFILQTLEGLEMFGEDTKYLVLPVNSQNAKKGSHWFLAVVRNHRYKGWGKREQGEMNEESKEKKKEEQEKYTKENKDEQEKQKEEQKEQNEKQGKSEPTKENKHKQSKPTKHSQPIKNNPTSTNSNPTSHIPSLFIINSLPSTPSTLSPSTHLSQQLTRLFTLFHPSQHPLCSLPIHHLQKTTHQSNSYDCGVFVVAFVEQLLFGIVLEGEIEKIVRLKQWEQGNQGEGGNEGDRLSEKTDFTVGKSSSYLRKHYRELLEKEIVEQNRHLISQENQGKHIKNN